MDQPGAAAAMQLAFGHRGPGYAPAGGGQGKGYGNVAGQGHRGPDPVPADPLLGAYAKEVERTLAELGNLHLVIQVHLSNVAARDGPAGCAEKTTDDTEIGIATIVPDISSVEMNVIDGNATSIVPDIFSVEMSAIGGNAIVPDISSVEMTVTGGDACIVPDIAESDFFSVEKNVTGGNASVVPDIAESDFSQWR